MLHGRAKPGRQQQRPRTGDNHAAAVARRVGRCHCCLHRAVARRRFDAVGVNHNILRRCRKTEKDSGERHQRQRFTIGGIDERHQANGSDDDALRGGEPSPASPETAGQERQRQGIDQRRPDELAGIGERRPAKTGHRATIDARFIQPDREAGKDKKKREASGKAEEKEADGAAVGVNGGGAEETGSGHGERSVGKGGNHRPSRRWVHLLRGFGVTVPYLRPASFDKKDHPATRNAAKWRGC